MNRILFLLFFVSFACTAVAQTVPDSTHLIINDSARQKDTIPRIDTTSHVQVKHAVTRDSFSRKPLITSNWTYPDSISHSRKEFNHQILFHHPYYGFGSTPIVIYSDIKKFSGKEAIFYTIILLLLMYAVLRQAFPKYFNDLFRLFFRTTIKQRQISEQLIQTPLPSLLLNCFFVVTGAFYISFVLQYFKLGQVDNFWLLSFYGILGLSGAYILKFIGLKISGWLFNMQEAANSYIFIVFVVNKMVGLLLLPFLVLLAFTQGDVYIVSITLSWCVVGGLLAYRFILTYAAIRNQVRVNPFHFFLYLLAFEIAPLLLIYKGLLLFLRITA